MKLNSVKKFLFPAFFFYRAVRILPSGGERIHCAGETGRATATPLGAKANGRHLSITATALAACRTKGLTESRI